MIRTEIGAGYGQSARDSRLADSNRATVGRASLSFGAADNGSDRRAEPDARRPTDQRPGLEETAGAQGRLAHQHARAEADPGRQPVGLGDDAIWLPPSGVERMYAVLAAASASDELVAVGF